MPSSSTRTECGNRKKTTKPDARRQSRIERRARGKTGLWEVGILADVRGSAQIGHPCGEEGRPRTQYRAHSEGQGTFV